MHLGNGRIINSRIRHYPKMALSSGQKQTEMTKVITTSFNAASCQQPTFLFPFTKKQIAS
jgi:hypothetical protein